MQEKLIFLHIPKNGGRTLHTILDRLYPKDKTFTIRVIDNDRLNRDEFIKMDPDARDSIKLLKGHMSFGLHELMSGNSNYITFLRNPRDRIISYYYYVLMRKNHRLHKQFIEEKTTLFDFVSTFNHSDVHNAQVRRIAGKLDRPDIMLEKALENIDEHFSFVGLTEKFDESLILLQNLYGWSVPYYKIQNKTKNRPEIAEVDQTILDVIDDLNYADQQLYTTHKKLIHDKISSLKNFQSDLYKLKFMNALFYNRITNFARARIFTK